MDAKQKKLIQGNNKSHVNNGLRNASMRSSSLKNKTNKTKIPDNVINYQKQRELVVKFSENVRFEYFTY